MLNLEIFNQGMEILCEVYQRDGTKRLLLAYYRALKGMTDKEFEESITRVLQRGQYNTFPMPGEILHAIPWDEKW